MYEKKPWLKFYGDVPESIQYQRQTMYEAVKSSATRYPDYIAYDFLGHTATYRDMLAEIDKCAAAFAAQGLRKGDRVTIALPNTPHAVVSFYALNKLGAIASMIHPLSAPREIEFYLKLSKSSWTITLDVFYGKFKEIIPNTNTKKIVLTRIGDYLDPLKRIAYNLTTGRKIPPIPKDSMVLWWKDLLSLPAPTTEPADLDPDDLAVIIYSGGTTGKPKAVMLSSMSFNCLGLQTIPQGPHVPGDSMLAILPMFHGFGLGVCIHTMLINGGKCILVPRFTADTVISLIRSKRPQFAAGVPTLFDALVSNPRFRALDLSCLKAGVCGGDSLPRRVKDAFDAIVKRNNGTAQLREGYGLAEAVSACMIMPRTEYRANSIGIPFSDMMAKVVKIGTEEEVGAGEEGEICISGPTLMLGYLDDPEETAKVLRKHADGRVWCHTGDVGSMDSDGFVYFKDRMKRLIKVSGFGVYPSQVEDVLNAHPDVALSCAIGVPDEHQMQHVKAFVVLANPSKGGPEMENRLIEYCQKNLIKWSCPKEIEFRSELPKTLVGKVAYKELEQQEQEKLGRLPNR